MRTHSFSQRPKTEPTERLTASIQPRSWGDSPQPEAKEDQPQPAYGFSHLDLFAYDPGRRSVPNIIQAKLTIGAPNDPYEQEADRVASQVVNTMHQRQGEPSVQREKLPDDDELQMKPASIQREELSDDDELQMKPASIQREADGGGEASADLESGIASARGSGQALEPGLQRQMGQAMGADFSGVKVHTDGQSDQLNRSIQSKAFTTGQDLFFRQGAYEPGSRGGQELIAHELTHVVQQNHGIQRRGGELRQNDCLLQASRNGQNMPGLNQQTKSKNTPKKETTSKNTPKKETKKLTQGEQIEADARKRLEWVRKADYDCSKLDNGVMDLIAGLSLNGSGGVVILDWGNVKATQPQKDTVVNLLSSAPVQAGSGSGPGCWHQNDHGKLPGGKKASAVTPYLEFLVAGYKGKNLLERAVFDEVTREIYMTCHYTVGSFVKITGLPASVANHMSAEAVNAQGFRQS